MKSNEATQTRLEDAGRVKQEVRLKDPHDGAQELEITRELLDDQRNELDETRRALDSVCVP